ncbi:4-hydroxy-tetrahydrodipicolinate synthase [Bacillus sp. AGMB 02131]|uniref:4-hydroxy-tetrahydrodipicolinate synthase n=1 Tax=Peribacillus faecalis TaxID=2772559 RepID=A0A927HC93_9BACI|nr:4-hydroxy-tetrahydrodipicolinate synthase [Peribacillus faecalis]MBD3109387.1 4-hydroxy-tetrahydrodipicolinate synthase [Peribacillus faecalis]
MISFGKVLTAMVTPFDHKGNIDLAKTTQLVNYLIENGTDSIVVSGTTGESPTLSTEEKLALFQHVVKVADKRVKVIAGTGSNNTYASIELSKKAEKIGVDGLLLVAPYYNKPNQQGLYEHFKAIAESTELPIMLYNIPGRTAVKIDVDTIVKLSAIPNIVALKESTGDLSAATAIIANTDESFKLYSGDDYLTLPMLAIGATGVVSVASHIFGNEMQEMIKAYQSGETEKAALMHQRLLPVMNGMFIAPNPTPVKTALQMKGIDVGSVRLPLVPLTGQEREKLSTIVNSF